MGYHYLLLSMDCIRECKFNVYVAMMDDYGLCPMVIKHIAFDYYLFLGK